MAITAANGINTTAARKENLFVIPGSVWPFAGVTGLAGGCILMSFKGMRIRGARFGWSGNRLFWHAPKPVATFAVSFVRNDAKNNAEMQQYGRQKKLARHLRILHPQ
jgi:hypothetical protein